MFKLEEFEEKRVLKSSLIDDKNIIAFFTTRDLPLKAGERTDLETQVIENTKLVAGGLKIKSKNLIIPEQTHSANVKIAQHKTFHKNTDALVTDKSDIAIALNFADCVPVIFYDEGNHIAAVAHAGWRGTAQKIAQKTIQKMKSEFDSRPQNIIVLIGPAIGKCCYEVSNNVLEKLILTLNPSERKLVYDRIKGEEKSFVDLKLINKLQILATGVTKIDLCEDCTCCKNELFFSYRKEKGNTARHSAVIKLN